MCIDLRKLFDVLSNAGSAEPSLTRHIADELVTVGGANNVKYKHPMTLLMIKVAETLAYTLHMSPRDAEAHLKQKGCG